MTLQYLLKNNYSCFYYPISQLTKNKSLYLQKCKTLIFNILQIMLDNIFGKRYTLEMLEDYLRKKRQSMQNDISRRCKILIIDDLVDSETYPLWEELNLLRNSSKYCVTTKIDLDNLNDAAGYDLIICDNQGIGKKICGSSGNGISLLKLLTTEYPGKQYVMLSNKEIKINRLESFSKLSTKISVWDKDQLARAYMANGEDGLYDHIQKEVERTLNPIVRWKEIRRSFVVNTNISLYELANIENAYIKSIIKNKPQIYERAVGQLHCDYNDSRITSYLKATKSVIEFTITIMSII